MLTPKAFRARIADVLKRCCGCDSYREPEPEVITEDEKAVDVASITALVTAQLAVLDAALAAWKATASTQARGTFSNIAVSAMYSVEWLIYRADEWYDADISVAIPDISMADMEQIAGGADVSLAAPAGLARTAKPSRTSIGTLRSLVRSSRESMRDYWIEYDDCGPVIIETCPICWTPVAVGCDCAEVVDDATAAVEQQSIATAMDVQSRFLVVALAGWDGAKHDALRDFFSGAVNDCLWRVDRLLDMQEYWYADAEPAPVTTVDPTQMRKFVAAIRKDGAPKRFRRAAVEQGAEPATDGGGRLAPVHGGRAGAEFSKKNKKVITDMHGHATEMVRLCETMITDLGDATDAGDTDDQSGDARMFRMIGPSSSDREGAEGHMLRISVADAPDAGAGERSNHEVQPPLYDGTTLRVKRS